MAAAKTTQHVAIVEHLASGPRVRYTVPAKVALADPTIVERRVAYVAAARGNEVTVAEVTH